MNVLLSAIGSRGDVQPLVALARALRARGHAPRLCVPPDFQPWIEADGFPCTPIGPNLEQLTGGQAPPKPDASAPPPTRPTPEQAKAMAEGTIRTQFATILDAARGCDGVVACGALQFATRSICEALGIPYVFAAYAPVVLPSPHHPPPTFGPPHPFDLSAAANLDLWRQDADRWEVLFGATLNEERAKHGLAPIEGVQRHVYTDRPLLAADPVLAPAAAPIGDMQIEQTGAWVLDTTDAPLPDELERFLSEGEPPIYFGLGSMRASSDAGRVFLAAARAVGRRAILSRGWGQVGVEAGGDGSAGQSDGRSDERSEDRSDLRSDWIAIGDVPHGALLGRVAAVVHHGGAGTTTAAALAGRPQVIVPHNYDQPYWGMRVDRLGVGAVGPGGTGLVAEEGAGEALAGVLRGVLGKDVVERAGEVAGGMVRDGAGRGVEAAMKTVA